MGRHKEEAHVKALFGAKFSKHFDVGKKEGRWDTMTFGSFLDPPVTRQTVSKWLNGRSVPSDFYQKQLCKLFKVREDYFNTENSTHEERYQYDSAFITELGKDHVRFANRIDLDLDLVRALSNVIDFNEDLPLYTPIDHAVWDDKEGRMIYDRVFDLAESAKVIDKDLQFLQLDRDGKRIFLSRFDLAFLKEVQEEVINYIQFLFFKRKKEMAAETDQFNLDLVDVLVDGVKVKDQDKHKYLSEHSQEAEVFKTPEDFEKRLEALRKQSSQSPDIEIQHRAVTEDFICDHDRFAKMVIKDARENDSV